MSPSSVQVDNGVDDSTSNAGTNNDSRPCTANGSETGTSASQRQPFKDVQQSER